MVTPTPAKARRCRAKKIASPVSFYPQSSAEVVTLPLLLQDSMQKEVEVNKSETGSVCGRTRSRRTLKTEFAAPPSSASSTKYVQLIVWLIFKLNFKMFFLL
jgi:hypothetical protein